MTAALHPLESRTLFAVTGLPFKLGSTTLDQGTKIAYLPNGGYVVAGLFGGTVDFDPSSKVVNLTSVGDSDLFVAEYTASSQLVWADSFGGDGMDGDLRHQKKTIDIAADPSRAGGDFVNGYGDAPLDAGEYLNALQVDSSGNVYFAGDFIESFDADPSKHTDVLRTSRSGYYNGFVEKLDTNGSIVWVNQINSEFTSTVAALAIQSNDNVVATGLFSRDVTFDVAGKDEQLEAQGRADGYVMTLSGSSGVIQWINQFGSDETDKAKRETGNDVALDASGNIYIVGTIAGNADFSTTAGSTLTVDSNDDTDGFIAKYTAAGRLRSAIGYNGGGYNGLTHIALDSADNIIVSGYFTGDDFDADPGSGTTMLQTPDNSGDHKNRTDGFIEKISGGRAVWVQQVSGDGVEFIDGLAVDSQDRIYAVGSYYDTAQFGSTGPTLTSEPGSINFHDNNDNNRDNSYDAFAWTLSDNGSTLRVKTFGSTLDDFGMGLSIGADDSVLLTGRFQDTVDFDPGTAQRKIVALGFGDVFISGLNQNGALLG